MRNLVTILLLLCSFGTFAQKVTISGYIKDSASGESLISATVFAREASAGVQTNYYGFYSVTVPKPGNYSVVISYAGYPTRTISLNLTKDTTLNVAMSQSIVMKEVEITTRKKDENVKTTNMGSVKLSIAQIKTLPVVFGEVDILKTLQLLPGVQSAGDGGSGFYVRGGGPDQNLVLLDEAPVYNTGHLFGFFSVFNSDAVKDVTLVKGGAPANYGSRLSSVVDVTMKEGNQKEYHVTGGIGLIASRFTLEGPLKKDKGSFLVSGRRTYIDVLARPLVKELENSGYYFYDLNFKLNYRITQKDRVFASAYTGTDKFKFQSPNGNFSAEIPWGNTTTTVRWNHLFNDKLFMNTVLIYNGYHFASTFSQGSSGTGNFGIKLSSGVDDYGGKIDIDYYTRNNHHIKGGVNYTHHRFVPNQISGRADTIVLNPDNAMVKYAHEASGYILDEVDVTNKFKINAGIRYSWFGQEGPYKTYTLDGNNNKTDSQSFIAGKLVQQYGGWEPRLNLRYQLTDAASLKASVAKTYQYLHLVSNNGSTLPTDIWSPSTLKVKPMSAWQYAAGYFQNFFDDQIETSVEIYYKDMKNQVQYKDGYTPNSLLDPELSFVFGNGNAYGAEFFVNKTQGKFTGWVGYTLAWTNLKFPDLNNGNEFPAKYDRRHDLSLVGSYQMNKKWAFGAVFVYATGNAITLPTAYYFIDNTLVTDYSKLNAYRTPSYQRLDISATYTPQHKVKRKFEGSWNFSIYNVYNHKNPYFMYVDIQGSAQTGIHPKVYEVYILPFLPSVTYNFKF